MVTQDEYATVTAAVQAWIDANAGFYASMIPTADVAVLSKAAADALDAYRASRQGQSQ
jgi:hypothetical protein